MKFDFDDILIEPATLSSIEHRGDINCFDENNMLPLFTAPMDTVICKENENLFHKNGINTILPRTYSKEFNEDDPEPGFVALGLDQFIKIFIKNKIPLICTNRICIDIANGHMKKLADAVEEAKTIHGKNLILMVGNVANPKTFFYLSNLGADYIRVGIGNGGGCLTTQNVGIGYPLASLIIDIQQEKIRRWQENGNFINYAKLVADGGMKNYSDIIKALFLGSDYAMVGSIFNKALESAGDTFKANVRHKGNNEEWLEPGEQVNQFSKETAEAFKYENKFFKKFRGMSTKQVQQILGNKEIRTSEGVTRIQPVEYTISGWVENFKHYLSTAMSYTDSRELKEFIGNDKFNIITQNSFKRFNK